MKYLLSIVLALTICLELFAQPKEEMRAVWLTSNYSLDWPSKPYRNSDDINRHQDELIAILDKLKEANFNAVFIQARLRGDVIYNSKVEPTSSYIAGVENTWSKYDPLSFAVKECHKRGLECHAWFVTYPLGENYASQAVRQNKVNAKRHKSEYFLDPGSPTTRKYLYSMVREIVGRYNIDGFHLDYIRYPENTNDFPDKDTYEAYGNGKDLETWRRDNINQFVTTVYDLIKKAKPWVQVSSSVLATYQDLDGSAAEKWTNCKSVFQDPESWLANGKHDFVVPMMYHSCDLFYAYLKDWEGRSNGRFIIPGIGIYQLDEKELNWSTKQILEQVELSRESSAQGTAFYRTDYLIKNKKGILDALTKSYYQYPALIPPLTWLKENKLLPPGKPSANVTGNYIYLSWKPGEQVDEDKIYYNIYRSKTSPVDITTAKNLIGARLDSPSFFLTKDAKDTSGYYYVVTTYDRYHNESAASEEFFYK